MITEIRCGSVDDLATVLDMMDKAVAWLAGQGRTGQWGEQPWSQSTDRVAKMKERLARDAVWIAEIDGSPAGAMTLSPDPAPYVEAAPEPEIYVTLLVTDRAFAGHCVGRSLLNHAVEETRRAGADLLRVDCYAGDDGRLVDYYRSNGFVPESGFTVGEWPGQVLAQRISDLG